MSTRLSNAILNTRPEINRTVIPCVVADMHVMPDDLFGHGSGYSLCTSTTFSAKAKVNNEGSKDEFQLVRKRMAEMIINEVFGEFREDFHKLRAALYQYDVEKALNLVSDLERRMFEV